ncbi:hypothetical protein ABPG75_001558 [Micractinium tetrahymenae]
MAELSGQREPPQELPPFAEELSPEFERVMEASRRIEHLDSAKDYGYEAEGRKHGPTSPFTTAAPPVSPRRMSPLRHTACLQKHLWFSDPGLEAEYLGQAAERSWDSELQWVALRALVWVLCAARLAAGGSPSLAAALAAACVAPAAVQLAAMTWRWEACKRHLLAAALAQAVSDVAGFAAVCPLYTSRSAARAALLAAGAAPSLAHRLLHFPCNAAAYMAFATLRNSAPFVVRFGAATALLAVQLFAAGPVSAAAAAAGGGAASSHGSSALGVALLAAAYCLPLCAVYRREARSRTTFACAHGRHKVDTSYVDAWDCMSFVLPALAQVLCLWCYIG